jgi:hypothetical protein
MMTFMISLDPSVNPAHPAVEVGGGRTPPGRSHAIVATGEILGDLAGG